MNRSTYQALLVAHKNILDYECPATLSIAGITNYPVKFEGEEIKANLPAFSEIAMYLRLTKPMELALVTDDFVKTLIPGYDVLVQLIRDVRDRNNLQWDPKQTLINLGTWFYIKFVEGTWTVKPKKKGGDDFTYVENDLIPQKFELLIKLIFAQIDEEEE